MAESPEPVVNPGGSDVRRAAGSDFVLGFVLAALTIALHAPLVPVGLNLGDEGWLVSAVDRLVGGERLYADVYRSYAPGLYWFFASLFRGFDADLVTIRWVWLGALVVVSVGLYGLARTNAPAWAAFGAALVPVLLRAPVHKTFVVLSYFVSLWLCRQIIVRYGSLPALIATGVGFGLVGMIRQEAAAFGLLIGGVSLIVLRSRSDHGADGIREVLRGTTAIALGVTIVWVPVVAKLVIDGSFGAAVSQLVVTGARGNAAMDLPFPDVQQILFGPGRLRASVFFLPGVATALGVFASWHAWRREPYSGRAIVIAQWTAMTFLSHSIFASRSDFAHLLQALVAPSLVLAHVAGVAWQTPSFGSLWRMRIVSLALGAWITAAAFTLNGLAGQYSVRDEGVAFDVPRNEVQLQPSEADTLARLIRAIQATTNPEEPILVLPYASGIYHVAERSNPTRHDAVLPGYASDEIQSEIIAGLERTGTKLVVIEQVVYDGLPERALSVYARRLMGYLDKRYFSVDEIGRFELLRRR